jgi:hypothetical protein
MAMSNVLSCLAVSICSGILPTAIAPFKPSVEGKCPSVQSFEFTGDPIVCGACACNPGGGVPNANLNQALQKFVEDYFCGCEGCYSWQTGCDPSTSWTFDGAIWWDQECAVQPCGTGSQRCIQIFGGTGTLACSGCSSN